MISFGFVLYLGAVINIEQSSITLGTVPATGNTITRNLVKLSADIPIKALEVNLKLRNSAGSTVEIKDESPQTAVEAQFRITGLFCNANLAETHATDNFVTNNFPYLDLTSCPWGINSASTRYQKPATVDDHYFLTTAYPDIASSQYFLDGQGTGYIRISMAFGGSGGQILSANNPVAYFLTDEAIESFDLNPSFPSSALQPGDTYILGSDDTGYSTNYPEDSPTLTVRLA